MSIALLLFKALQQYCEIDHALAKHGMDYAGQFTENKLCEGVMVIYLDDYRKAKATRSATLEERYGEELMCANWNPMISVSAVSSYQHPHDLSPRLPDDFESVDVDAFLDRVYMLASQV